MSNYSIEQELLQREDDDRDDPTTQVQLDLKGTFETMMKRMATREHSKRVTFAIKFEIAKGVVVAVKAFVFASMPCSF